MTIRNTKYIISPTILNQCKKFGTDSVLSSIDKYAERHGFDLNDPAAVQRAIDKFSRSICNGKIGEEFSYQFHVKKFPNLSKPDYQIYSKGDKSWSADLKDKMSSLSIAVKSQDRWEKDMYGESWIFQSGKNGRDFDKGIYKDINDKHYVTFVSLNVPKREAQIRAVVKVSWLHERGLFKPTGRKDLQDNKQAVYYEDLQPYTEELWQL